MAYQADQLQRLGRGTPLGEELQELVQERLDRLIHAERPRYQRLWAYYRNPMHVCASGQGESGSERPYRQSQEWGLPSRITGFLSGSGIGSGISAGTVRKEVVIENDIAWRVETQVEYLFGKPLVVASAAPDPERRQVIGELLRMILAQAGGITFLQQLALLGGVYGFVDVLVKFENNADESVADISACGTQDLGQNLSAKEPSSGARPAPAVPPSGEPASPVAKPSAAPSGDEDDSSSSSRMNDLPDPGASIPILCDATALDQLTSLGAAGIMGAMWLWERRTSRQREQQIDEAHTRILSDRVQLDQLISVVKQNSEAFARFSAAQEQLLRELNSTASPR